jgi:hypothetical protein
MAKIKRTAVARVATLAVNDAPVVDNTPQVRRRRRLAALTTIAGIWSQRDDIPADGLNYQREMRTEWQ